MKTLHKTGQVSSILFLQLTRLLALNSTAAADSARYSVTFDPIRRNLYVVLSLEKRIISIPDLGQDEDEDLTPEMFQERLRSNWELVAGIAGKVCLRRDERKSFRGVETPTSTGCGDGGLAVDARLAYPKVSILKKTIFSYTKLVNASSFRIWPSTLPETSSSPTAGL